MGTNRGNAVAAGWFFVVAFVAAIAGLALYQPALSDPAYVLGAGDDTQVLLGGFLELLLAGSCIGTGVALYPVMRQYGPSPRLRRRTAARGRDHLRGHRGDAVAGQPAPGFRRQ